MRITFDPEKRAATLGKAAAMGGSGKTDEAVKLVEDVIAKTDSSDDEIHARANVVLGNCYKAAGKKKEARLAFLHVHLLFPRNPELHAEALANLAALATDLGQPERAACVTVPKNVHEVQYTASDSV